MEVKGFYSSLFSALNKIFDIAPEVLIGVAVDLVVRKMIALLLPLDLKQLTHRSFS